MLKKKRPGLVTAESHDIIIIFTRQVMFCQETADPWTWRRCVCLYVCVCAFMHAHQTSLWARHLREWQHMIGSHHATKVLQPITNPQFILYMAQVGVGCGGGGECGGLNTRRRPILRISSRPLFLFLCVSFYFFVGVMGHSPCQNCRERY